MSEPSSGTPSAPVPAPAPGGSSASQLTGPIPPYFGSGSGRSPSSGGPVPAGPAAGPAGGPAPVVDGPAPAVGGGAPGPAGDPPTIVASASRPADAPPTAPQGELHATAPVSGRPRVLARRTDPLTRMGPWAPLAGALFGLVSGLVAVLFLAGAAEAFGERLALVFLVVGLVMLGAAAALLADEVRMVRRGAREAAVRPAWVETTAGLLHGLTPARLLTLSSAFVLFLAAFVAR